MAIRTARMLTTQIVALLLLQFFSCVFNIVACGRDLENDVSPESAGIENDTVSLMQTMLEPSFTMSLQTLSTPPPIHVCNAESHVFRNDPHPLHRDRLFTRVIAAGIMSSGSTWLRSLIRGASGRPTCAIYKEEGCVVKGLGAFCDSCHTNGMQSKDSFYVKTHWPQTGWSKDDHSWLQKSSEHVVEGWSKDHPSLLQKSFEHLGEGDLSNFTQTHKSIDAAVAEIGVEDVATDSMSFDKLMLLVRHPLSQIHSFTTRWTSMQLTSEKVWSAAEEVYCWSAWWLRVRSALPKDRTMTLRYEDLCRTPDTQVDRVLGFLGYRRTRENHSEKLDCHEKHSLADNIKAFDAVEPGLSARLIRFLHPILASWGYEYSPNLAMMQPVGTAGPFKRPFQ